MGGETVYMPTFNKDKDSLAADINGTYHGTDETDKVYYDDYVVYTTEDSGEKDVDFNNKETVDGPIYSVGGLAYYDDDTDTNDNKFGNSGVVRTEPETHTAKKTANATVMTMADFLDPTGNNGAPGNYWVYDDDGWAYWANPIMPGEATGLLLNSIDMEKNPGEKCYYGINVVGQFATVGDWEYFTDNAPSENAMALLEAASAAVPVVTVANVSGATTVEQGQSYNFDANVSVNGASVYVATDFEWSVLDENMNISETSTITNGVLSVNEAEQSKTLTIVAKANDYLGAVGMSSVAVNVKTVPVYSITVDSWMEGNGLEPEDPDYEEWKVEYPGYFKPGKSYTLNMLVDGVPVEGNVTWNMELKASGMEDNKDISNETYFDANVITIAEDELQFESFGENYNTWHAVWITGTDSNGNTATLKTIITDVGLIAEALAFYDVETGEQVEDTYSLVVGTTYNVKIATQVAGSNFVTEYLDDVSFDGVPVQFLYGEDEEDVTSTVWNNFQFTPHAAGSFNVRGATEDLSVNLWQTITAVDSAE